MEDGLMRPWHGMWIECYQHSVRVCVGRYLDLETFLTARNSEWSMAVQMRNTSSLPQSVVWHGRCEGRYSSHSMDGSYGMATVEPEHQLPKQRGMLTDSSSTVLQ